MNTDSSLRDLGQRIRRRRTVKLISRRVLADLAGLHENTLKAIENGHGNPTYRVLLQIAESLGVSIRDLLG
jgi:transcriptional regulator with XRE-family HTH domain